MKLIYYILILLLIIILTQVLLYNPYIENFNGNNLVIVIARYNENLEWLKESPFNDLHYIVYNKGNNENYYISDKFIKQVQLDNVGRETHTYLSHIIDNYDNLNSFTIFFPGSIELENRHDRAKQLINDIIEAKYEQDIFACVPFDKPVLEVYSDFTIDNYLSSNELNKQANSNAKMLPSEIRPFGEWYKTTFGDINADSKCFTKNSMFGIKKDTILLKPKSYYEKLLSHVNSHHNHETVHYFERAWETVFYPHS